MHNEIIQQRFLQPLTLGSLANADAIGQAGIPGEGPYMTISVRAAGDCIEEARFETYGCPTAIACGSWITQWAKGRTLAQVGIITPADLSLVLGGLPLGKEHCAQLAVDALRSALHQLQST